MSEKNTSTKNTEKQIFLPNFFITPDEDSFLPKRADFVWNFDIPKRLSPFARIRKRKRIQSPKRAASLFSLGILVVESLLLLGSLFQALFSNHLPAFCGTENGTCQPETEMLLLFCIPALIAGILLALPERFFGKAHSRSALPEQRDTLGILQSQKRSADTLVELGEYASALSVYEEILQEDPCFGDTILNAGNALAETGKTKKSLQYFQKAAQLGLGKHVPFFAQGTLFLRENKREKAISFLKKAQQIAPQDISVLQNLGITLLEQGCSKDAHDIFQKALSLYPKSVECLFGLGISLFRLQKYKEAQHIANTILQKHSEEQRFLFFGGVLAVKLCDWKTVERLFSVFLSKNSEEENPRIFMGNALVALNHLTEAEEVFRKISSNNHDAKQNLAGVLFLLENWKEALLLYESLPKSPNIFLQIAECQNALKEGSSLLKTIEKAMRKVPRSARLSFLKGNAHLREKNFQKAILCFEHALSLDENLEEAHLQKGEILLEQFGNPAEAEKCFRKSTEQNPKNAVAWYKAGICLVILQKPKEAGEMFTKTVEVDSSYSSAYFQRGTIFLQTGNVQKAIMDFDAYLKENINDLEALYNKGLALFELGKYREAITAYNKILATSPAHLPALINKGNALFALEDYWGAVRAYDEALSYNERDAFAHYNKACALNLLKNRDLALRELELATILDESLREEAQKEESFKNIRRLKIFRMIVGLAS
ncbi:tetratricopeptide repeat protein [Candidatus Peregrinibacteria bacterium]|nr:MAG: tetratricopeptide repeat protein [Candidatus Peregrinibacteria bacterium]